MAAKKTEKTKKPVTGKQPILKTAAKLAKKLSSPKKTAKTSASQKITKPVAPKKSTGKTAVSKKTAARKSKAKGPVKAAAGKIPPKKTPAKKTPPKRASVKKEAAIKVTKTKAKPPAKKLAAKTAEQKKRKKIQKESSKPKAAIRPKAPAKPKAAARTGAKKGAEAKPAAKKPAAKKPAAKRAASKKPAAKKPVVAKPGAAAKPAAKPAARRTAKSRQKTAATVKELGKASHLSDAEAARAAVKAPPPPPAKPLFDFLGYLESLERFGIKLGLSRIEKLLKALDDPQKKLQTIHIVGTNGKSSTARMISAILSGHGMKSATYLSPHLVSFNERFLVGGKEITDQKLEKLMKEVHDTAEEVNKRSRSSGPLTQFEILTAAAFLYFRQQKVDVAVVETGLGGRYDATNVIESKVQVFTNAELEHTDLLGGTVEEIVREKTAIIPEKGNVVLGALSEKAMAETLKICERKNAKTHIFGEDFSLLRGRGEMFDVWTPKSQYGDLALTLFGQYQRTNCAVAIQAAELFLKKPLDEKKLKRVLPNIKIPGRLEIISEKPMVILDGAHNPSGIEELLKSLATIAQAKRTIGVVSILKDKDAEAMLGKLLKFCDILFITENSNPRCAKAQDLAKLPVVQESSVQTFVARENQSALESAFKLASIRDVILITGSLYLLADIKRRMI